MNPGPAPPDPAQPRRGPGPRKSRRGLGGVAGVPGTVRGRRAARLRGRGGLRRAVPARRDHRRSPAGGRGPGRRRGEHRRVGRDRCPGRGRFGRDGPWPRHARLRRTAGRRVLRARRSVRHRAGARRSPGGPVLLGQAGRAGGDDDRFNGVSDDELLGIICAADRCEAAASALKHTAVAALIRRRPASGCTPQGPAGMPEAWDEFTRAELAPALGESRYAVDGLLDLAHDLTVKLPGPWRCSGTGSSPGTRRRSSSTPPSSWTPRRPGPRRRWCWTGRGG